MAEQDIRDELGDLIWSMNDRIILIAILGVFGFMILSFASMHSDTFTQSDIDTINFVFRGVAALLSAYAVLPFFRFGLEHWDERIGKAFALGAPVAVVLAYVV
jgi:hypothetical protein